MNCFGTASPHYTHLTEIARHPPISIKTEPESAFYSGFVLTRLFNSSFPRGHHLNHFSSNRFVSSTTTTPQSFSHPIKSHCPCNYHLLQPPPILFIPSLPPVSFSTFEATALNFHHRHPLQPSVFLFPVSWLRFENFVFQFFIMNTTTITTDMC